MEDNPHDEQLPQVSRRSLLKSLGGVMGASALPSSLAGLAVSGNIKNSINPRWYGFNLLEYFSTDTDWMKYFPYKNDGHFREDDFRWIGDWGFNWVRLPMDYRFWTDPNDLMKIDEKKIEPIDRAIRLGEKYGVHVNICLHRAPGECILDDMNETVTGIHITKEHASVYLDQSVLDAFVHQWVYFAKRYKGISSAKLSFNIVNEPVDLSPKAGENVAAGMKKYARVARATIEAIRAVDPERLIVSDGYPYGVGPVQELVDTKVIQSRHDYSPSQLTHFRTPWARPQSDEVPVPTWPLNDSSGHVISDKETKRRSFSAWAGLASRGVPIHFGEIGCNKYTPAAVANAWFNDTLDLINELHSGWALWNFRGGFGVLDNDRAGAKFKNWHGHQLDVDLLNLLKSKVDAS